MNKNTLITAIIIAVIAVVAIVWFAAGPGQVVSPELEERAGAPLEEEVLSPVEVSAEEQQVLQAEGITLPGETDQATEALEKVGTSNAIESIEQDVNATNLSDLDAGLKEIENSLQGL